MKNKLLDIIVRILKYTSIISGVAAFIIGLGTAGRDEMLSEIGKSTSFNPLPGLALAIVLLIVAVAAKATANILTNSEEN